MAPKADEMLATLGMELFFRFGRKCFVASMVPTTPLLSPPHLDTSASNFRYDHDIDVDIIVVGGAQRLWPLQATRLRAVCDWIGLQS
jgi:hypothetical protein